MSATAEYVPEQNYPTGKISSFGDHLRLLAEDKSTYKVPFTEDGALATLDAIAIPTARKPEQTHRVVGKAFDLVRKHRAGIVIFICSGQTTKEDIAKVAHRYPEQRWLAVDWQLFGGYSDPDFATTTSHLARGKNFNASEKRNFILQLARLMKWRTLLFLDDDIEITPEQVSKAAHLLHNGAEVVGFNVREYPDHSVAVHANQIVNKPIDSFIGTGAMAVRVDVPFLSFFPNSYNNDWFFAVLHSLASDNGLVWAGMVKQKPYNPFHSTKRAEREEPGDLLAEGLFRLIIDIKSRSKLPGSINDRLNLITKLADEAFWQKEINARLDFIQATTDRVRRKVFMRSRRKMLDSLRVSAEVINGYEGTLGLKASDCMKWLNDWVRDVQDWNKHLASLKPADNLEAALAQLGHPDRYLHGSGILSDPGDGLAKPHVLYDFLNGLGKHRLEEAMLGNDSREFIQDTTTVKGNNLIRLVKGTDRLRHDRPLSDIGIKPAMTVIMFVRVGEDIETVKESVRAIVKESKRKPPIQLVVWVYPDNTENHRQLNRYRNLVVSEVVLVAQGTGVMLLSGITTASRRHAAIDAMIHDTSESMLLAYWKLGRRPMPHHRFIVVNSKNEPLRFGTIVQLIRGEHVIPDKSLSAYLSKHHKPIADNQAIPQDENEIVLARERLSRGMTWRDTTLLGWYTRITPTLALMWTKARARLSLKEIDDLAYTIEIHHERGWTAIQDVDKVLCARVEYMQGLPGDVFALARRIASASKHHLRGTDAKSCMILITASTDVPWEDLQGFRSDLIATLTRTPGYTGIVYTSLLYRHKDHESSAYTRRVARALARYIYWLENHRNNPRYIWHTIGKRKYEL